MAVYGVGGLTPCLPLTLVCYRLRTASALPDSQSDSEYGVYSAALPALLLLLLLLLLLHFRLRLRTLTLSVKDLEPNWTRPGANKPFLVARLPQLDDPCGYQFPVTSYLRLTWIMVVEPSLIC
ncbi:hypothetical protein BDW75DRAFT_131046 [Aspergillus navahoensis]